jgi:phenylalanyl-tRNA synthetase beta chain
MLCSERELGLGEEHAAGVLELPGVPVGADLVDALGLDDDVLEIEITPNRVDCLSVVGIARELAALTGATLNMPPVLVPESDEPIDTLASVRIEAPDLCHRFTGRLISGVRVGPSPAWMASRLRAVGLRPISNVVDVTNYVMWERGHPLHAFDHAAVTEATVVVRRARPDERITTLDGQERALDPSMLLIADTRRGIGIAGVMGGAVSEVTESTTRVLLESAYFRAGSVRRTARTLGLLTDAAYRFERGADIEALVDASHRATALIVELGGGRVARGMIDAYPTPHHAPRVRVRMDRVQRVAGTSPPREEARRILVGLGLPVTDRGQDLEVEVPSFRRDLAIEDDLVEEIIRVWGYDRIPSSPPTGAIQLVQEPPGLRYARTVRAAMVGAGLNEVVTYSFSDPGIAEGLRRPEDGEPLRLLNPLSQDASLLRAHPLEGVLAVVATNLRRQQPSVRVFEVARTYVSAGEGSRELRWVSIAVAGARRDPAWYNPTEAVDVYDAKGLAEHALAGFGVATVPAKGRLAGFEPDAHGALAGADGAVLAEFGEVSGAARERFGIEAPVFAAVVSLDALEAAGVPTPRHVPLPRFPAVERDMAFLLEADQEVAAVDVEAAIWDEAGPLLHSLAVFDQFRLPDGRRSLGWRLTFQADDRTLTDEEVNAIHARVARRIANQFNISLRGTA